MPLHHLNSRWASKRRPAKTQRLEPRQNLRGISKDQCSPEVITSFLLNVTIQLMSTVWAKNKAGS